MALTVIAELGDLTRFDNPRQLAAFVGLTPSEHTSGEKRRQGGITKTGNGRARRVLIEGAWAYRYPAKISAHIQRRIEKLTGNPRKVRTPKRDTVAIMAKRGAAADGGGRC